MPNLGGGSAATAATMTRGVFIPAGWGATWKAARATHASTLVEAVILGDSTWWGQSASNNYSAGNYSPVTKIRAAAIAAGYTDGGPGVLSIQDSGPQQGTVSAVDPVTIGTMSAGSNGGNVNIMGIYGFAMSATTSGSVQGWYNRARVICSALGDSGSFTYSLNGAAAVTITPGTGGGWTSTLITMPSGRLNTITLTNVAGVNRFDVDLFNDKGLVLHRNCIPGGQIGSFVPSPEDTATNAQMGVLLGGTQQASVRSILKATPNPQWRNVKLVGVTLGVNDLTQIASIDNVATRPFYNAEKFEQSINAVCEVARGVGADVFFTIPHYKISASYTKAGAMLNRIILNTAIAQGAAVVDTNEALGGAYQNWSTNYYNPGDVHLKSAGYQAIGQYVWDNLLSL